jgi:hypothetical protein
MTHVHFYDLLATRKQATFVANTRRIRIFNFMTASKVSRLFDTSPTDFTFCFNINTIKISVPDPDPPDPHVLGLPDPDPLVRGMGLDPDPSFIKQKY